MDKLKLTDLVEENILQEIQDVYISKNRIATSICDADGEYLTDNRDVQSDFCDKYIKKSAEGRRRCKECDCINAENAKESKKISKYKCHAGLVDFSAPICVEGELYGFIVGGQICTEPLSKEHVEKIANELGIDAEELYEASKHLNVLSEEKITEFINDIESFAHVISDIAGNKYQMLKLGEEMEAVSRMKSDFLANMSHEIRTPMNAIIGMADIALRKDLSDEARSYITQIKRSGNVLLNIINDILDFSKIESGKMDISLVEYSPMVMINDIANIIKTRIGDKPVEFTLDVSPDIPGELMGDDKRIEQVITNLSNNAVKFTHEGQVHIEMSCEQTSSNMYMLSVSVEDTGIGIKEKDLEKIFESFQQVDSKRNRNIEGSGLGLAISRRLIDLMDGTMEVQSVYEEGSTFSFKIPQIILREVEPVKVNDVSEIDTASLVTNKYVEVQMEKDIKRLGGICKALSDDNELKTELERGVKYIFAETKDLSDDRIELLSGYKATCVVVLLHFNEEFACDKLNYKCIRKPLYTYNLIKLFNHETVTVEEDEDSIVQIDFIAPDAKVLVVDDNDTNLTVAVGLMNPLQMNVETAISGQKAMEMIGQKHYDIIFMDHMMPEMDGVETTRLIRRFHPEYDTVPIIALTANAMEGAKSMFLVEGMNDFVAKPIEAKNLIDMLRQWLPSEKIVPVDPESMKCFGGDEEISIPGLDVTTAVSRIGNTSLYMEVLRNYYKTIPRLTASIKSHYDNGEWEGYTIDVHALKSSSRQIGAMELGSLAESLEEAGNQKDIDTINQKTEELLLKYQQVGELIEDYAKEEEVVISASVAEVSTTAEILEDLMVAMDDLDATAMDDCVSRLKNYKFEDEAEADLIGKLFEAIDILDIDTCEMLVQSWKEAYQA